MTTWRRRNVQRGDLESFRGALQWNCRHSVKIRPGTRRSILLVHETLGSDFGKTLHFHPEAWWHVHEKKGSNGCREKRSWAQTTPNQYQPLEAFGGNIPR